MLFSLVKVLAACTDESCCVPGMLLLAAGQRNCSRNARRHAGVYRIWQWGNTDDHRCAKSTFPTDRAAHPPTLGIEMFACSRRAGSTPQVAGVDGAKLERANSVMSQPSDDCSKGVSHRHYLPEEPSMLGDKVVFLINSRTQRENGSGEGCTGYSGGHLIDLHPHAFKRSANGRKAEFRGALIKARPDVRLKASNNCQ